MSRILVVGVEPQLRRALSLTLQAQHYDVRTAPDPTQALPQAATWQPDLVILDLDLPDLDVIAGVHGWSHRPIIVLSAQAEPHVEVAVLDAGADDYIAKPFGIDEFLARVRAVIRRTPDSGRPSIIAVGDLRVDLARKTVTGPGGDMVHLTPIEWAILEPLLRSPRTLIERKQLLTAVWGPGHATDTHYLRIYLASLRHKLEPIPSRPRHLITEPGMGYRFEP
ncbi:winged helix-turn-helix domain-containing protein [Rhodococcus opacus]|uniref:winged helix-turn-helix domain-containing protein n=1 Tax=Rhodococcus opacus TaxID=37919 RepID=UPI001F55CA5E|nr:winged helix-turn-helix domain-containing protein [Rhodococcus opacus]UNM99835.1 winged helix-turn-helix domain-containing protein [Rhodococcus opacus]